MKAVTPLKDEFPTRRELREAIAAEKRSFALPQRAVSPVAAPLSPEPAREPAQPAPATRSARHERPAPTTTRSRGTMAVSGLSALLLSIGVLAWTGANSGNLGDAQAISMFNASSSSASSPSPSGAGAGAATMAAAPAAAPAVLPTSAAPSSPATSPNASADSAAAGATITPAQRQAAAQQAAAAQAAAAKANADRAAAVAKAQADAQAKIRAAEQARAQAAAEAQAAAKIRAAQQQAAAAQAAAQAAQQAAAAQRAAAAAPQAAPYVAPAPTKSKPSIQSLTCTRSGNTLSAVVTMSPGNQQTSVSWNLAGYALSDSVSARTKSARASATFPSGIFGGCHVTLTNASGSVSASR